MLERQTVATTVLCNHIQFDSVIHIESDNPKVHSGFGNKEILLVCESSVVIWVSLKWWSLLFVTVCNNDLDEFPGG